MLQKGKRMNILEKDVEKYLKTEVEKIGGLCLKWISPGNSGVPDRIVIYRGMVRLVEMKRPGGKLRMQQIITHKKLRKAGVIVDVLYSIDDVDRFIFDLVAP